MRLKKKDSFLLFNATQGEWEVSIEAQFRNKTQCRFLQQTQKSPQDNTETHLFFGLLKKNALDTLIQKATETGVTHLHPCTTRYSVVQSVNQARLSRIAKEAAEQSNRLCVPIVSNVRPLLEHIHQQGCSISAIGLLSPKGLSKAIDILSQWSKHPKIGFVIGPEGGWHAAEESCLESLCTPFRLGPNILRSETAATVILGTWLQYKPQKITK